MDWKGLFYLEGCQQAGGLSFPLLPLVPLMASASSDGLQFLYWSSVPLLASGLVHLTARVWFLCWPPVP